MKLSDKKKNPRSKYWQNKADAELSRVAKGPCAICGADGCGHHLISRSHKIFRHDLRNIITLCPVHHRFSNELAPRSTNALAVTAFVEWVKENRPDQYEFWQKNQHVTGIPNYKEAYEHLREI